MSHTCISLAHKVILGKEISKTVRCFKKKKNTYVPVYEQTLRQCEKKPFKSVKVSKSKVKSSQ